MFENAKWIIHKDNILHEPVRLKREFKTEKKIKKATLNVTSLGCYFPMLNGQRVGEFILAPGFTSRKRVQYQTYDVTSMIQENNSLEVIVSDGWYNGKINFVVANDTPKALICQLDIEYCDGAVEQLCSDNSFLVSKDTYR